LRRTTKYLKILKQKISLWIHLKCQQRNFLGI
jgi:hypothetical protein